MPHEDAGKILIESGHSSGNVCIYKSNWSGHCAAKTVAATTLAKWVIRVVQKLRFVSPGFLLSCKKTPLFKKRLTGRLLYNLIKAGDAIMIAHHWEGWNRKEKFVWKCGVGKWVVTGWKGASDIQSSGIMDEIVLLRWISNIHQSRPRNWLHKKPNSTPPRSPPLIKRCLLFLRNLTCHPFPRATRMQMTAIMGYQKRGLLFLFEE